MSLAIVILAAGKGTRMKSNKSKVLHELAGQSLLGHVVTVAEALSPSKICIVYGHQGEQLRAAFADKPELAWAEQSPQLGTGHAVQQAVPFIAGTEKTLILYGDVPLTQQSTLENLLATVDDETLALLTAFIDDPKGYGRIIRNHNGEAVAIVEEKDASDEQKQINEINTGIMAVPSAKLNDWLSRLDNNNAQGEYYLTDVIALAVADGAKVLPQQPNNFEETLGINSRQQLAELERYVQLEKANQFMAEGVTIKDPARFDVRGNVSMGKDVTIDVGVVLNGTVTIGDNVTIEPFCVISDSDIAADTIVKAHSVIENSQIGEACDIGPFARIRPETVLANKAKIGNFVEVKKSHIGEGSKVNHLSYVGDAEVGNAVNIGAGTITCNYDGANKHKTIIDDGAFIGSDTQLVAPVRVGKNTTIGAGSTITKDTPEGGLSLSRSKQTHLDNWQRPVKNK